MSSGQGVKVYTVVEEEEEEQKGSVTCGDVHPLLTRDLIGHILSINESSPLSTDGYSLTHT